MSGADSSPVAVLFDFDHTLFAHDDSPRWVLDACRAAGRDTGGAAARALYDRMLAERRTPGVTAAMRGCQRSAAAHRRAHLAWFGRAGADEELARALYARLLSPEAWTPYEDVGATLAALHAHNVPVGVVSNVGWDIRPTFAAHGLAGYVGADAFVLSCEEGAEKPDPGLFRTACARLGVPPGRALMVGDDPVNDGAAVTAGLRVHLLPDRPPGACRGLAGAVHHVLHADTHTRRTRRTPQGEPHAFH
ncbi:HAD-IA family hydrolase [Streptomyces sp. NPDC006307]|uniref:HAD family hydrolase n=1 Tax=Streptomyces sp. NPDC006307 TaxID=3156748 RepID=UPI0033B717F9